VNGQEPMLRLIGGLPAGTPVAFEAAYGWGWLVELLEDYGFDPHLVHPLRCKAIASARLKNDKVDAAILAQLLRAGLLPEAWIAPQPVRQLRAQLRHRASLVRLGTQLRNRIHAVAADHGYDRAASYWTGPGRGWLAELHLPPVSREIVADCLASIDALAPVIERLDGELHQRAKADPRVKVLRTLPGVGNFLCPLDTSGPHGYRRPGAQRSGRANASRGDRHASATCHARMSHSSSPLSNAGSSRRSNLAASTSPGNDATPIGSAVGTSSRRYIGPACTALPACSSLARKRPWSRSVGWFRSSLPRIQAGPRR
jgi:Transposase